jgi:hypothetical protein
MVLADQNHYQVVGVVFDKFLHHRDALCLKGSREHVLQLHFVLTQIGESLATVQNRHVHPGLVQFRGIKLWWDKNGGTSWLWVLGPINGQHTRFFNLLVRFTDFIMMRKYLLGIRRRAEALALHGRRAYCPVV